MGKNDKLIKVEGFYITPKGDLTTGVNDAEWVISKNIYFRNQKDLDGFVESLYQTFENFVGVNEIGRFEIETFEERKNDE